MKALVLAAALLAALGWANPLTYSDIPDNDVIRVGDSYYMVSTTMFFCPGAPIMKSDDLVHWRTVNYIFDCLEDDDVYNLRGGRNAYGKGQWATSLRYHNGTYYALFIANDQPGKTYIYKTADIERGPWHKTVIPKQMHDASMLFDTDGRLYVVWGNGDLRITELESDASALKAGGIDTLLLSTPVKGYGLRAEGAHVYHIGEYYYILEIDWPRKGIRTETCWRSRSLTGEWESRVVLKGTLAPRKNDGVAQGAIVDTPQGDWYAIMFQDHGAVGRIPTLQRVTWTDGWPIMGEDTVPETTFAHSLPLKGEDYVWSSDEFEADTLAKVWQWNHKPVERGWSLAERPGWLRLKTSSPATDIMDARGTLTQRTAGPLCSSEVLLDASGLKPGDNAGICAFQSHACSIGIEIGPDGARRIVARNYTPGKLTKVIMSRETASEKIRLRIDYNFNDDTARISYSESEQGAFIPVDYVLRMKYTLDYFVGYRTGLYCYSTSTTGGFADFGWFRQEVTSSLLRHP